MPAEASGLPSIASQHSSCVCMYPYPDKPPYWKQHKYLGGVPYLPTNLEQTCLARSQRCSSRWYGTVSHIKLLKYRRKRNYLVCFSNIQQFPLDYQDYIEINSFPQNSFVSLHMLLFYLPGRVSQIVIILHLKTNLQYQFLESKFDTIFSIFFLLLKKIEISIKIEDQKYFSIFKYFCKNLIVLLAII